MALLIFIAIKGHIKQNCLFSRLFKIFYWFQKNAIFHSANLKILIYFLPLTLCVHGHRSQILSRKLGQLFHNKMVKFRILLDNKQRKNWSVQYETIQHSFEIDSANLSPFLQICFTCTSYGISCFSPMVQKNHGVYETARE